MADFTTTATEGAGLAGAVQLAANNFKMPNAATKSHSRFGTRELVILNVAMTGVDTTPNNANSNLVKAIKGIQTMAQVVYVGIPDSGNVGVIVEKENLTGADGAADETQGFGLLEAAIQAATGVAATVTALQLSGNTLASITYNVQDYFNR